VLRVANLSRVYNRLPTQAAYFVSLVVTAASSGEWSSYPTQFKSARARYVPLPKRYSVSEGLIFLISFLVAIAANRAASATTSLKARDLRTGCRKTHRWMRTVGAWSCNRARTRTRRSFGRLSQGESHPAPCTSKKLEDCCSNGKQTDDWVDPRLGKACLCCRVALGQSPEKTELFGYYTLIRSFERSNRSRRASSPSRSKIEICRCQPQYLQFSRLGRRWDLFQRSAIAILSEPERRLR
jgi:hypothetical protein